MTLEMLLSTDERAEWASLVVVLYAESVALQTHVVITEEIAPSISKTIQSLRRFLIAPSLCDWNYGIIRFHQPYIYKRSLSLSKNPPCFPFRRL